MSKQDTPSDQPVPSTQQSSNGISRRGFMQVTALGAAGLFAGSLTMVFPRGARAQSDGVLRLGVMGPMTGPASRTGEAFRQGAILALEDAREAGEIPITVDGEERDIELVFVDSESDPESATRAVRDAVERQGVEMMVAGWHSSVAMAMTDAIADLGIVHIGHNGESQYICEKINEDPERYSGWFKGWASPPIFAGLYGEPLRHFMDEGLWTPPTMNAAVMVEDTDFGRGWGDALVEQLGEAGFDVRPYDVSALDETEFTSLLTRYRARNVSLVGMTTTGSVGASNFVKQFRAARMPALLLGHGLTWFPEWYDLTGEASDFTLTMDSPRAIAPYQEEWLERYRERFDEDAAIAPAGHSYDYMRIALKVIHETGTMERDRLIETTRNIAHQGVWHFYDFAEEPGERALCYNEVKIGGFEEGFFFPMVQLKGGETNIIWPLEHAQAEFEQPPWI